jgi:hypothetical protein
MEIWKMCEGEYEVSSEGRVRRNNAIKQRRHSIAHTTNINPINTT